MKEKTQKFRNVIVNGIGVCQGVIEGRALLINPDRFDLPRYYISRSDIEDEIGRLGRAIEEAGADLARIKKQIENTMHPNHALIIDAHMLFLRDEMLVQHARECISNQRMNAEWAVETTIDHLGKMVFEGIDDEYLRERKADLNHVGELVMRQLLGRHRESVEEAQRRFNRIDFDDGLKPVIIAHDLSPADTAQMDLNRFSGFSTDIGGRTSHTAIIARALGMPAVVGTGDLTRKVITGDIVIVDGADGVVIVDPDPETREIYRKKQELFRQSQTELLNYKDLDPVTSDGRRIRIEANIELSDEAEMAIDFGAEGVGLFRTEYLYMNRTAVPTEEEIYQHFVNTISVLGDRRMIIRVLDIGGDKFLNAIPLDPEENSALGLRAIRLLLQEPNLFRTQLRAILRASAAGDVGIMLPMVSRVSEVRQSKVIIDDVKQQLRDEGVAFAEDVPVGIMIETPASCIIADHLARESDFFSIGTNDLIQYTLTIDRTNERVAHLYQPLHPAILRMIHNTVCAANEANIPVGMCGEMASDPFNLIFLIGVGLDSLSMDPQTIPLVKKMLRQINYEEAKKIAETAIGFATHEEVHDFLAEHIQNLGV